MYDMDFLRKKVNFMRKINFLAIPAILLCVLAGCRRKTDKEDYVYNVAVQEETGGEFITVGNTITKLDDGLSVVRFDGDYGFDSFLSQGGAESDEGVIKYLASKLLSDAGDLSFGGMAFGCSTISASNKEGGYYFGRNFDWNLCDAIIVMSYPKSGYASLSTVNLDFIKQGAGPELLSDKTIIAASLYAPLDGMNEKGLCVAVNMIQDSGTISQSSAKPDITTTTAVRMLLNKAATTDEAIELLKQYDFHASMDYMVHLAVSDSTGRSVVIEYINNEMKVIETSVVTNFYLAEGEKNGIGTEQSHIRYGILEDALKTNPVMDKSHVKNALSSVSKGNFGEFESTEWSIIFDQSAMEAVYYHRENYNKEFLFRLEK